MGVGDGLFMYDVVVKSSRSLSHLLTSSYLYSLIHTGELILTISTSLDLYTGILTCLRASR